MVERSRATYNAEATSGTDRDARGVFAADAGTREGAP